MSFPKKLKNFYGFTLLEVLITLGILAMTAAVTGFIGLDVYRGYYLSGEASALVALLQQARSESMENINNMAHGLHIGANSYSVFEGSSYSSGIDFPRDSGFIITGPSDIVFSKISGTTTPAQISLSENSSGQTSIISINNEGQISY